MKFYEDENEDPLAQLLAMNQPMQSPLMAPGEMPIQVPPISRPKPKALAPAPLPIAEEAAAPAEAPLPKVDPREYIRKKYGLDKYSDAERQKIVDANEKDAGGLNISAALAVIGAGFQGKDSLSAGQSILRSQQEARRQKLSDFDSAKAGLYKQVGMDQEIQGLEEKEAIKARENDINSAESKLAQDLAKKMAPSFDFSGMTATQINEKIPALSKIYDIEQKKLDRKEARDERRFQQGVKIDEKMQGLKTPFGLANNEDDAKKLKEGYESKKNFDNKIQEMIALREKHGGGAILNREDIARGKQLSKDLLLEYKNMAKLGVLSQADENIINAIIPEDPLEYNSPLAAIQGQDPTLNRLRKFKEDSDKDFTTRVSTRTRDGQYTPDAPPKTVGAVERLDKKTGKIALFDPQTKQFLGYK